MEVQYPDYEEEYSDYVLGEEELAQEEFYVDQFFHDMEEQGDEEFLNSGGGLAPFSVSEILEHCIEPTLTDAIKHMGKILAWCLVFRIATQSARQVVPWLCHAASVVSGTILAAHFFGSAVFFLLGLVIIGYMALAAAPHARGLAAALTLVTINILCEVWLVEPQVVYMVRGAVMVISMKIISLGFDMDVASKEEKDATDDLETEDSQETNGQRNGSKAAGIRSRGSRKNRNTSYEDLNNVKDDDNDVELEKKKDQIDLTRMPGWFEFAGYCLCPGTVILGPWVSFTDYINIFKQPRWNLTWVVKILFTVMFAFMFLTISTCWNPWLIPDSSWIWWLSYRDAMSFRASHYFVSFMSEASVIAAGFGCHVTGSQVVWHYTVTQPHNVEVPRSLVEVVISWNLPMHKWLKQYVFKPGRSLLGPGPAVLLTYLVSTLLHGLSFRLGSVLLSLGIYTWVEHSLRNKLAIILEASITARRETEGRRKHREGIAWVILINMLFGLLAMFHLAYLGVMFDQSNTEMEQDWTYTLTKWGKLGFTSHWVVAGMAVVNWLI